MNKIQEKRLLKRWDEAEILAETPPSKFMVAYVTLLFGRLIKNKKNIKHS
jgi:hypothetical protein